MTVCIGALCADNEQPAKNAVVVSDRMVTLGRLTEFEHEVPKITNITPKVVALVAGDALRGSQLIKNVIEGGGASPFVRDLAHITAVKYAEMRDGQLEADFPATRTDKNAVLSRRRSPNWTTGATLFWNR